MARVRFLQPYDNHAAGDIGEVPGGIASVLALRRIVVLDTDRSDGPPQTAPGIRVRTRDVPGPTDTRRTRKTRGG